MQKQFLLFFYFGGLILVKNVIAYPVDNLRVGVSEEIKNVASVTTSNILSTVGTRNGSEIISRFSTTTFTPNVASLRKLNEAISSTIPLRVLTTLPFQETTTLRPRSLTKFVGKKEDVNLQQNLKGGNSGVLDKPVVVTYRLKKGEDGGTCILMTVDALISFVYKNKFNGKDESDLFIPEVLNIDGDCSNEDLSKLTLKWGSYTLLMTFSKTPGGERWFVSGVSLTFNTAEKIFEHIVYSDKTITAATGENELLFPTPVGNSFKCHREITINLKDPNYPDVEARLLLRELTLQPFIFKNDEFGPEYLCSAAGAGSFRSENLPFFFGTLLAISAIMTVAGYAVYRYFKVSRVQYDTME